MNKLNKSTGTSQFCYVEEELEEEVYHTEGSFKCSLVNVKLEVEGKILSFKIDTGCDSTLVLFDIFKNFYPNVNLVQDFVKLKTFFGESNLSFGKEFVEYFCTSMEKTV